MVFQMTGTRVSKGNATVFEWDVIPIDLEKCNIGKFPNSYHEIMKDLPFSDYYCMKKPEFEIAGTFLYSKYKYLMIKLFECTNSTTISKRINRNRLGRILKENEEEDLFEFPEQEFIEENFQGIYIKFLFI